MLALRLFSLLTTPYITLMLEEAKSIRCTASCVAPIDGCPQVEKFPVHVKLVGAYAGKYFVGSGLCVSTSSSW